MAELKLVGKEAAIEDSRNSGLVPRKRKLVIIGAGGFGAIAASTAQDMNAVGKEVHSGAWEVIGYADSEPAKQGTQHSGYAVHGTIEDVDSDFHEHKLWFFCAIGDGSARARMVRLAEKLLWQPATLIHPSAVLATSVEIGVGSYIGPGAVISVNAKLGTHSVIDMHASIGHDACIGDFCTVFPGARITGGCRLGEFSVIGSNATLLPGTFVGNYAVVGANSLAHRAIEPDTTVLGVPARVIHRRWQASRTICAEKKDVNS